ncbi:MAG: alpha/beta fold hydrolase [Myxococcales bacterium]|nr:alpha/beta fold hydrolase [Myxococcales bacterium]
MSDFYRASYLTPNHDGWELMLRRTRRADLPEGPASPVLIVPGYGMNAFIFGFHPSGRSLSEHLAWRGLDVFTVDLRAQGDSVAVSREARRHPTRGFGLAALSGVDLTAALDQIRDLTGRPRVSVIGASLGATLVFAHLALVGPSLVDRVVSLGGPLRWESVHPMVALAFSSPRLAGALHFRGTRRLAAAALPLLTRAPSLLRLYVNAEVSDLSRAQEMVATVADPIAQVNREIAEWIAARDLVLDGRNVTEGVRASEHPLLCVLANADGVVPQATARSPFDQSGSRDKSLLVVGDPAHPYAHADLFIAREAEARVFEPIARFLATPTRPTDR